MTHELDESYHNNTANCNSLGTEQFGDEQFGLPVIFDLLR